MAVLRRRRDDKNRDGRAVDQSKAGKGASIENRTVEQPIGQTREPCYSSVNLHVNRKDIVTA